MHLNACKTLLTSYTLRPVKLCGEFSPFCTKKIFLWKKFITIVHERVLKIFMFSYFEWHQIWLNILMDVHHLSNITKLKKEKREVLEAYSSHKHILPFKVALLMFIKCPPNTLENLSKCFTNYIFHHWTMDQTSNNWELIARILSF